MESPKQKSVLISGASIAGLSTALWMNKLGYNVTVVELASKPRTGGTAVDLRGNAIDIIKRMEIYDLVKSNALNLETIEFKNSDDVTENLLSLKKDNVENPDDDIEIERTSLINILVGKLKNEVEFMFSNSITALTETENGMIVTFRNGPPQLVDFVFGCDGTHSIVRKIWFGNESEYLHFLEAYFSIAIVDKLLISKNTMQFYNVPGKAYMLNTYKNKTDIIFCFLSEKEIPYDYRNIQQQREIISNQFVGQGWRTAELWQEITNSENFYFDKFCQLKMPSWTKGRVALVGDAAYCASPAAGMGGSLAIEGAATLADAFREHNENFDLAFREYNQTLRPFIEAVQAEAELNLSERFIPKTEEAIRKRNATGF